MHRNALFLAFSNKLYFPLLFVFMFSHFCLNQGEIIYFAQSKVITRTFVKCHDMTGSTMDCVSSLNCPVLLEIQASLCHSIRLRLILMCK